MARNLVLLAAVIVYVSSEPVVHKEVGIGPDGRHYEVEWEIIKQHKDLTHGGQHMTPTELGKSYRTDIMTDYLKQHPKSVHDILLHRKILNEMGDSQDNFGHQMGQEEEDTGNTETYPTQDVFGQSIGDNDVQRQIFPGKHVVGHLYGPQINDYGLGEGEGIENSDIQDTLYPTFEHLSKYHLGQQQPGEKIVQIQGIPYLVKGTVGQSLGQHGFGAGNMDIFHLKKRMVGHLSGHQIGQHDAGVHIVDIQGRLYPVAHVGHLYGSQIGQCDTNGCQHIVQIQGKLYPVKYVLGHSIGQHELSDDVVDTQGHLHPILLNRFGQQDVADNVGLLTGHQVGQQDVAVHVVEIQGRLYPIKHVGHLSGLHDAVGGTHFVEMQGKLWPVKYVLGHSIDLDSDVVGSQSHLHPMIHGSAHLFGHQGVGVDAVKIQGRLYPIKHLGHLPGTDEDLHFIEMQGKLYPVKYTLGHSIAQHGLDLEDVVDAQGHFHPTKYVEILGTFYPVKHVYGMSLGQQQFDTDTLDITGGFQPMKHLFGRLSGQYNERTHDDEEIPTEPILVRVLGPHGGFQMGHHGYGGYIQH